MSECDYKLANANIKGKEKGGCLEFFFNIFISLPTGCTSYTDLVLAILKGTYQFLGATVQTW